jgi:peptidoglycan hydrolase-like protein with peptidoglycan-binding domain
MRYKDFKIVETKLDEVPDDGNRAGQEPNTSTDLQAGPPYPQEDTEAVRALQSKLEELGYSVGSTGIDGKYGPRTTAAVRSFKQDHNVEGDGLSMSAEALEKLNTAEKVDDPTPTGNEGGSIGDLGDLADLENLPEATEVVNSFLGSNVEAEEMNMLLRAIASEASRNSQERAAVAAVILNRVRSSRYPNSIEAVLTQGGQFQAVTGTRTGPRDASGRRTWTGPSRNFSNMSDSTAAEVVGALIRYLPNMDKTWLNFTANNPRAYGAGTNINFMYAMRNAEDSQVIGQTVFGTA